VDPFVSPSSERFEQPPTIMLPAITATRQGTAMFRIRIIRNTFQDPNTTRVVGSPHVDSQDWHVDSLDYL
jgi:hypothetical protein